MKTIGRTIPRRLAAALLGVAFLLALGPASYAAVFAKYDGIDGESADRDHDKWIDVLSIDWGANKPGGGATGQSRRRGAVVVEDLRLVMEYDKASPKLQEKCLKGEVIPKLEIEITSAISQTGEPQTYLRYELKDVLVTSYRFSATGDGGASLEVSINFTQIEWTYTDYEGKDTDVSVDRRTREVTLEGDEDSGEDPRDPAAAARRE